MALSQSAPAGQWEHLSSAPTAPRLLGRGQGADWLHDGGSGSVWSVSWRK